jgi:hypothetical protein
MYKIRKGYYTGFIFSYILLIQGGNVIAQDTLSDNMINERIRYIQTCLENEKPNANLWWKGWIAGYAAATVGQGISCLISDKKSTKQDMALGAATTLLGAAGQLFTPMVGCNAPGLLAKEPDSSSDERLAKLKYAEKLFENSAKREKLGRSWQAHALSGAVNLSSGLITWIGFKRSVWAGLGNFAFNMAITEAQIWSQPTRAIRDYKLYNSKYKSSSNPVVSKPEIQWFVSAYPGGISFRINF